MKFFYLFIIFFNFLNAFSDQNEPILNDLFEKLQNENFSNDKDDIVKDIWGSWGIINDKHSQNVMDSIPLYLATNQYEEAIEALNNIIIKFPDFAEAYNKRATIFFIIGNYNLSMIDIKSTLMLEPRHFGALDGMARILIYYKKYNKAMRVYNEMKLLMPFDKMIDLKIETLKEIRSIKT